MTTENENQVAATSQDVAVKAEEKPVDNKAGQEDGDFVEMPKDIQKKFNKLYKEKKAAAERNQLLEQHVIALTKKIEAVSSEVNSSKVENTVSSLKEKLQHAKSIGDDDVAAKIEDQLLELRLEKKIADKTKKETPKAEAKVDNPMNGVLSRSEINIVSKWAHEEDEDGEYARPWAVSLDHPKGEAAAAYLAELLEDSEHDDLTIKEKLKMVDEKFGRKKKVVRDVNAVGEGSLTKTREKGQMKLSPEQEAAALKIFRTLPRDEAIKMYIEGMK